MSDKDPAMIPAVTRESIDAYMREGQPLGTFLMHVVSNNLFDAVPHADKPNREGLSALICYIYQEAPSQCHGSREVYNLWIAYHFEKREGDDAERLAELSAKLDEANTQAFKWRMGRA